MLFSVSSKELRAKVDACLPSGMKIDSLEQAESPRSFIVKTERTFAVYTVSADTLALNLTYYHGA